MGENRFEKASLRIQSEGPHTVLMTQGPGAVFYRNRLVCGHVEAFRVRAVDMVGCGDAFAAGVVSMYLGRMSRHKVLDRVAV